MKTGINVICLIVSLCFFIVGIVDINNPYEYHGTDYILKHLGYVFKNGIYLLIGSLGLLLQVYIFNKKNK